MYGKHDALEISDCPTCGVRVCVLIIEASSSSPRIRVYCGEGCEGDTGHLFNDIAQGALVGGAGSSDTIRALGAPTL